MAVKGKMSQIEQNMFGAGNDNAAHKAADKNIKGLQPLFRRGAMQGKAAADEYRQGRQRGIGGQGHCFQGRSAKRPGGRCVKRYPMPRSVRM